MLVGVFENGQMYFVRTDHIGRPVFATDSAGTKVWEARYLPFGGVQASSGPNSELRFPGQWFQAEAGLHQNWMRDYDPTTGRYMQADPLGLVDGASVYGYALQNPGRYYDPTGQYCLPCVILAGAAIGAAIDIAFQYYETGGEFECFNWWRVGVSAGVGGLTGGAGNAGKAAGRVAWESSHFIPGRLLKNIPDWLKATERTLNRTHVPLWWHAATDPLRHNFISRAAKSKIPNLGNPLRRRNANGTQKDFGYPLRIPPWLAGGAASGASGWGSRE